MSFDENGTILEGADEFSPDDRIGLGPRANPRDGWPRWTDAPVELGPMAAKVRPDDRSPGEGPTRRGFLGLALPALIAGRSAKPAPATVEAEHQAPPDSRLIYTFHQFRNRQHGMFATVESGVFTREAWEAFPESKEPGWSVHWRDGWALVHRVHYFTTDQALSRLEKQVDAGTCPFEQICSVEKYRAGAYR